MPTRFFGITRSLPEPGVASRSETPASIAPQDNRSSLTGANTAIDALPVKLQKPRLLLMGMRRSGKTSIRSVVFEKMEASETLFLEATRFIQKIAMNPFLGFEIWDLPGLVDFLDPAFDFAGVFGHPSVLVWVIDAQDDYFIPVKTLHATIIELHRRFPAIHIEVFIHKVDGLSEDYAQDILEDISYRTTNELADNEILNPKVQYHLTSIYDSSIREALGKVAQKLITPVPMIENMLNLLCSNTEIHKVFLFDSLSKICIATDSSPVDEEVFDLCSDYIDMVVDISTIYSSPAPDSSVYREASSMITLGDGNVVYLQEMNRYLLLACIMHKDSTCKMGLINYNIKVFQKAVLEILDGRKRPF